MPGRIQKLSLYTGDPAEDNPLGYFNLVKYGYNANSLVSYISIHNETIKTDYTYNERNWIQNCISREGILSYNMFYFPNGNVQSLDYNGTYKNNFASSNDLMYEFSYDKSNRLLSANCTNYSGKGFDVDNTYDKDGNILTLKRYKYDALIKDDFNYTYYPGTNKLKNVTTQIQDFLYDNNGNLIKDDLNKNFDIKYDHRNLITFLKHLNYGMEGEVYTTAVYYFYDEAGNRMRKVILQSYVPDVDIPEVLGDLENYTKYKEEDFNSEADQYYSPEGLDNPTLWFLVSNEFYVRGIDGKELIIYNLNELKQYNFFGRENEGYIDPQDKKHYYLKDHLGSVRVILDDNKSIVSANDYDAWGYLMEGRSFNAYKAKYKFTGKERDTESNYDYFGARYYDSRIGRWFTTDPSFEKSFGWSFYKAFFDNPIKFSDPNGEFEFPKTGGYEKFSNYLEHIVKELTKNKVIMKELRDLTGLSKQQIQERFEFGSGPKIEIVDYDYTKKGQFDPKKPDVISINKKIIDAYELSFGKDTEILQFLIGVTLLHEFVHYGRNKSDLKNNESGPEPEYGYIFEERVYGKTINNYDQAKEYLIDYKKNKDKKQK